jgi:predicted short-subunit dehydrogenase-like oxidoreductase (DUF2520 family)
MPSTTPPGHASSGVAIVGSGRLGSALARALRAQGVIVEGPLGRGASPQSEVVLLCVPDGEIARAAATVGASGDAGIEPAAAGEPGASGGAEQAAASRRRFIGHVSGATPLTALAGAGREAFGLHPLQTFAGGEGLDAFDGVGCAIAGTTPEALAVARDLAERLGMTPIEISDSERAAYHAAASIASNFLVTLQAAAEELADGAGIDSANARALLGPLVRSTVDNWVELGPTALTGPVARGDDATVDRQREAVEIHAPHLLPLFDELVKRTRALAAETQTTPPRAAVGATSKSNAVAA